MSYDAERTLNEYYENVQGLHYTDMQQRVFHYRRIIDVLINIDVYFDDVKSWNDSLIIDIDNFCKVQFVIDSNQTEVFIEEIYFNYDIHQWQTYHY
ncbi:hypothetical protein FACS189434_02260 [Bacteroidia bacterium]|nr:hypothetical protein FACS189434_02260 [Bacteroidia bacterium]